ncbi:OCRE domain-containing protein [Pseudoclavibacter sp. RFBA6]|uniref:OCRE domain-containing protein n=1 Tax=Pseudoclavibacter sp. RFBA6 TaxID=2080573 RepID=UPI000CE7D5CA|nr:OCRE domain-containing protein [Pseudoclavibacter sp. RFBA6]PPG38346.1 hypothetical protein C5C17_17195 [Pseudoclavibacter sp. RFBA6]
MSETDRTLIDTTRAHRERMLGALAHGPQATRRTVNTNVGRLLGSVILGAVICCACLGTSFVVNLLEDRKQQEAISAFQAAAAANPVQPGGTVVKDEATGFLLDQATGQYTDPRTGFVVDPATGYATDPAGKLIDTRIGWYIDPATGYYTNPTSGITIDPQTLTVVE